MAAKTPPDASVDVQGAPAPRTYDFACPAELSAAERKWLENLHAALAERLEASVAGLVRDYVEIQAAGPSVGLWSGLVGSLPSPCTVFAFEAPPLKGTGLLRIDPGLAFALVDRLFGGTGEPADLGRELTAIEQQIAGRFADAVLAGVESVWKPVFDLGISRNGFAPRPDLIEAGEVDEPVIEVAFTLKAGPLSGSFTIAYPLNMFEPALGSMFPGREKNAGDAGVMGSPEMIKALPLAVTVRLAPTMVDIGHLADLGAGDVLLLDNRVSEDVEVLVGSKTVMKGRPGIRRGRLAVKITRFSEEGG